MTPGMACPPRGSQWTARPAAAPSRRAENCRLMNRTYVRVEAASGSAAIGAVQAAVVGHGAYGDFQAQPL